MKSIHIAEEKRTLITKTLLYAAAMAFFLCVLFVYYSKLYSETKENIINKGEIVAIETSDKINMRMLSSIDIIKSASFTIDNMIKDHSSTEEICDYMVDETDEIKGSLIADTTGVYGYVNGEYLDGAGWVPDESFVPTQRPWYIKAISGDGEIVTVDPYIDMDTGKVMITLANLLCDKESVVAIDLSMDDIQFIMENQVNDGRSYAEFIVSSEGRIIAHSDKDIIGKDIYEENDPFINEIKSRLGQKESDYCYLNRDNLDYLLYFMPLENDWMCVSVIDATDDFVKLRSPLIITAFISVIIVAIFSIILMFSEKKDRMARELSLKTERAMAASEAKTAFLSNMSHEIRTPVNAILGMNEMILRESDDKSILDYSSSIKSAGSALLGLINDVLDFSKIEAGKIEIIPVDYDLSSILNDLVLMIHSRADEKGLELNLEFDKTTPKLLNGDEIRIKQIIANILTNAVKYTEKGSITFNVGYHKVEDDQESVFLDVYVKDTGIGIKPEDIEKLYLKFERIEEKRNRNIEGTGLGMNITTSLLNLMDSKLEVSSVYGEGSVFGFSLKQKVLRWDILGDYRESYKAHLRNASAYKGRLTAPDARVLIVDDNPMNLTVIKNLMKQTKINVDMAEGGFECLKKSKEKQYDLIFLDHMMPGLDGIETLHELHADTDNPNLGIPVICLTANAVSGAKELYINAGFDDYMTKPIDFEKLEEILSKYLPGNKVTLVSEADEEEMCSSEDDARIAALDGQGGIDTETGVKNNGTVDAYLSVLKIFLDSLDEKAEEIERLYNEGDYKDYTIKVHALKSSAKIIGATEFAEKAQQLEDAGKAEDIAYIDEHHNAFMQEYRAYKDIIAPVFDDVSEPGDKDSADEDLMSHAFKTVREAADDMDCDRLESIIEEMKSYEIPDEYSELWGNICILADQFDYSGVLEILDSEGV